MNLMIDDWAFYEGKPIKVKNVHEDFINFFKFLWFNLYLSK